MRYLPLFLLALVAGCGSPSPAPVAKSVAPSQNLKDLVNLTPAQRADYMQKHPNTLPMFKYKGPASP